MSLPLLRQQWRTRLAHNVGHCSPAHRLALHAPRSAGYCLSPTAGLSKIDGSRSQRTAPDLSMTQNLAIGANSFVRSPPLDATGGGRLFSVGSTVPVCSRLRTNRRSPPTSESTLRYATKPMQLTQLSCIQNLRPVSKPFVSAAVSPPAHKESGCTILFGYKLPEHRVS